MSEARRAREIWRSRPVGLLGRKGVGLAQPADAAVDFAGFARVAGRRLDGRRRRSTSPTSSRALAWRSWSPDGLGGCRRGGVQGDGQRHGPSLRRSRQIAVVRLTTWLDRRALRRSSAGSQVPRVGGHPGLACTRLAGWARRRRQPGAAAEGRGGGEVHVGRLGVPVIIEQPDGWLVDAWLPGLRPERRGCGVPPDPIVHPVAARRTPPERRRNALDGGPRRQFGYGGGGQ